MNNFWALTKISILSLFNNGNNKKKKTATPVIMLIVLGIVLFGCSVMYNCIFNEALRSVSQNKLLPAFMFSIASVLCFITSIVRIPTVIYDAKDYDMLESLPIKTRDVILSKFVATYIVELAYAMILMIPGIILVSLDYPYIVFPSIICMIFVPVIPMLLGALLGFLFKMITRKMKHKNIINTFLYLIFFIGIFALSFSMNFGSGSEELVSYGQMLSNTINSVFKFYPVGWVVNQAIANNSVLYLILFLIGSLILLALVTWVLSSSYKQINTFLKGTKSHNVYKRKEAKCRSTISALIHKDLSRITSIPMFLINIIIGPLMVIIIAVLIAFSGESIKQMFTMADEADPTITVNIIPIIQMIPCLILGITNYSVNAISIEGSSFWILKSSPISYKDFIKSKLITNGLIFGTVSLISSLIMVIGIRPDFFVALEIIICPFVYTLAMGAIGLWLNLTFPKLEWDNPTQVFKNSMPVMLSMLFDFLIMIPYIALLIIGISLDSMKILPNGLFSCLFCFAFTTFICLIVHLILFNKAKKKYKLL